MRPSTLDTRAGQTRCPSTPHRHVHGQMTCARCGVTDGTVAQTINRDGVPWPATCSGCSAVIREKSARIAAVERAVARG